MLVPQSIYNELVVLGPTFRRKKFHHLLIHRRHEVPIVTVHSVSEPHVCSRVCVRASLKANRQCGDSAGTGTGWRKHPYAHHARGVRKPNEPGHSNTRSDDPDARQDDNLIPL